MGFVSMVLANIFGRLTRSLLTVSGMAVAICAVVSLVGIARGFQKSLRDLYEARGVDVLVTQSGKVQQSSSVLAMSLVDEIRSLDGVDKVAATLMDALALDSTDLVAVPVQGWANDSFLLDDLDVMSGRSLKAGDDLRRFQWNVDLQVLQSDKMLPDSVVSNTLATTISELEGVDLALPMLLDSVSLDSAGSSKTTVYGWPLDSFLFDLLTLTEGRLLEPQDSQAKTGELLIGSGLAAALGKGIGDAIKVSNDVSYEVVGIFDSEEPGTADCLLMSLSSLQELTSRPGEITSIALLVEQYDAESLDRIKRQIEQSNGDVVVTPQRLGGLLIGSALATSLEMSLGDYLNVLEGAPFEVIGIFDSYNVFESGSVIMPLSSMQDVMLRTGEVTAISVISQQHDAESLRGLQERIEQLGRSISANTTREFAENTPEMKMTESVAWLTSSIALVVGTIGMFNTMLMAVFERTKEIAMLRAIGWRRRRIVTMILSESVVLALAGAVVGCVSAVLLTHWLSQLPAANGMISGHISNIVIVWGFVLAVVLGVFGGLYPAYRAARLLPVEGLRHN